MVCSERALTIAGAFLFVNFWIVEVQMNIEEQVEQLMLGTEYGDEELKKAMTNELRQRLIDAEKE